MMVKKMDIKKPQLLNSFFNSNIQTISLLILLDENIEEKPNIRNREKNRIKSIHDSSVSS